MAERLVFSYLAFSTPRQAEGRSSERQGNDADAWAERNGFRIAPERQYCDLGISRFRGRARMKGALSRFLALCGTAAVPVGSILVIEDFDRLSRETPDDAWELFRRILLADVEIVVLSLDRWFKRESLNRFEDRLLVQACQHRAHQESAMKSARIRDLWAARRRHAANGQGRPTNLPSWMRRDPEGVVRILADRAETLRLMVRRIEDGLSCYALAKSLAGGPDARPCWLRKGQWDHAGVENLLKNPALFGAYQPHRCEGLRSRIPTGELIRGYYPALFTEEEVGRMRRCIRPGKPLKGRPARPERSVLRGLVRDAETGQTLRLRPAGEGGRYDYLERRWRGGTQLLMPYKVLEALVLHAVQEWAPDALDRPASHADGERAAGYQAELDGIAADREAVQTELAKSGRGRSTIAILAAQLDSLEAREKELLEALDGLSRDGGLGTTAALRECQTLAGQYALIKDEERPTAAVRLNSRLRNLLEGIWIYRHRHTARTAEVVVQIWSRTGRVKERRVLLGKPAAGWTQLQSEGVDFRRGYPKKFAD
jgi:DNA invertase Pin-like site-specific DNA recombinase